MRGSARVLLSLALFLTPAGRGSIAQAAGDVNQQVVIIVHPSNPSVELTRAQVAEIFRRLTTEWPGHSPIHPVDQSSDSTTRQVFSRAVFAQDVSAVKSYWLHEIYSGRAVPPPEVSDDNAVARIVRSDPGAIGYVASGQLPNGVKAIRVVP